MRKILAYCLACLLIMIFVSFFSPKVIAVVDPRVSANNKFGIGILSPEANLEDAKKLVNSNGGDWGYVKLVIRKNERDILRWQGILNNLNKQHLIPIIRIATDINVEGGWSKPGEEDAQQWADFLNNLPWPIKNRYVQIYNEVNRSSEWGGTVDPQAYAKELEKTINALKTKSDDFFVMNAPLDLALQNSDNSLESADFFEQMEDAVPGIFTKLDGFASHSYPNPGFMAKPDQIGRLGIRGFEWETSQLAKYLNGKKLPIFITETGWVRENGEREGLDENTIADFYESAFSHIWILPDIVSVTPFVLDYPDSNFNQFSFKKLTGDGGRPFYEYYYRIQSLKKNRGEPERDNKLSNLALKISGKIIKKVSKEIILSFKNEGNILWEVDKDISIQPVSSAIDIQKIEWQNKEIYPGQEAIVRLTLKSNEEGFSPLLLKVLNNDKTLGYNLSEIETLDYISFIVNTIRDII